jgi:hypothetical protein
MATETGHIVNIGNFKKLINILTGWETRYAPEPERLKLPYLNAIYTAAVQSVENLDRQVPLWLRAVNARVVAFEPLNKLVTRVLFYAEAIPLNPATLRTLKDMVRKIHGSRAKAMVVKVDGEPTHHYISVSQRSFEQRIEHFSKIVAILNAASEYRPNEADLSVAGLTERLEAIRTANAAATAAILLVDAARNARNVVLYSSSGIVDLALDVKKYVGGAFGLKSHEYMRLKSIPFRRPSGRPVKPTTPGD